MKWKPKLNGILIRFLKEVIPSWEILAFPALQSTAHCASASEGACESQYIPVKHDKCLYLCTNWNSHLHQLHNVPPQLQAHPWALTAFCNLHCAALSPTKARSIWYQTLYFSWFKSQSSVTETMGADSMKEVQAMSSPLQSVYWISQCLPYCRPAMSQ